jgi:hypothetical protein
MIKITDNDIELTRGEQQVPGTVLDNTITKEQS